MTAQDEKPVIEGVSGEVGTIERDDGTGQVTLDGLSLYTDARDSDAGDVTGQGVQGTWWVVSPDGAEVTGVPASQSASEPSSEPESSEPAPVHGY